MRPIFAAALALLHPAAHASPSQPSLDIPRFIRAVRMVENSRVDYVSHAGARGIYQLKRKTWEQYSKHPFEWANEPTYIAQEETLRVARAHAHWVVEKAIPALNLPLTVYSVALLWIAGFGNVERLRLDDASVSFAHRVENIYESIP